MTRTVMLAKHVILIFWSCATDRFRFRLVA